MTYILMTLFVALAVAADQLVKHITVTGWLQENIPGIEGLVRWTYTKNTGAAWSMFEGQQWLFAGIFLIFTVAIIWEFSKKRWPFKMSERWAIVAVFAGGLGNMIDRLRLGYVVDMIELEFIRFPVFNVADCFITCGCIFLLIHLVFFNKAFWKDDKKK